MIIRKDKKHGLYTQVYTATIYNTPSLHSLKTKETKPVSPKILYQNQNKSLAVQGKLHHLK